MKWNNSLGCENSYCTTILIQICPFESHASSSIPLLWSTRPCQRTEKWQFWTCSRNHCTKNLKFKGTTSACKTAASYIRSCFLLMLVRPEMRKCHRTCQEFHVRRGRVVFRFKFKSPDLLILWLPCTWKEQISKQWRRAPRPHPANNTAWKKSACDCEKEFIYYAIVYYCYTKLLFTVSYVKICSLVFALWVFIDLLPRLPHFHPGWIPAQMHIKFFVLLLPRACNTESLHLMTWFLHTEPLLGIAWLQLCDGQWGQGVPNRSNIFKYIVPNILLWCYVGHGCSFSSLFHSKNSKNSTW